MNKEKLNKILDADDDISSESESSSSEEDDDRGKNSSRKSKKHERKNKIEKRAVKMIRSYTSPLVLRRMKEDVLDQLPSKISETVYLEMHSAFKSEDEQIVEAQVNENKIHVRGGQRDIYKDIVEVPRINDEFTGVKNRYAYAGRIKTEILRDDAQLKFDAVVKFDFETGDKQVYEHGPGRFGMESQFVPRATKLKGSEDDGWLVLYVHDENTETLGRSRSAQRRDARYLSFLPVAFGTPCVQRSLVRCAPVWPPVSRRHVRSPRVGSRPGRSLARRVLSRGALL